jgi:hypothetical protein
MVVNIVGKTVTPVSVGTAQITITNSRQTVIKNINVKVLKANKKLSKEKKCFFNIFKK